jgi:hypothetical protein
LTYGFGYNNRTLLPPGEPQSVGSSLNTYAQDHWGYYNGALNNTNLLPPNPKMPPSANFVLTSNREADTVAMQYGSLNKITYPTGGYTEFKFEANRYNQATPVNGAPPGPIIPIVTSAAMSFQQPVGRTVPFEVFFNQSNVNFSLHFNDYAHPPNKRDAVFPYVRIERLASPGTYATVHYWDAYDNFPSGGVSPNSRGFYDFDINATLTLAQGSYRLIVNDSCPMYIGHPPSNCLELNYPDPDPADDIWIIPMASAQISYKTYDLTPGVLPIGGGLRVKEIKNFTDNNILATRKQFTYDPGNLLMYPGYMRIYERYVGAMLTECFTNVRLNEISSTSQTILGFTQGAAVAYAHVTEEDVDVFNNNQGFTSYNFSYTPDSLNEVRLELLIGSIILLKILSFLLSHLNIKEACYCLKSSIRRMDRIM